MHNLVAIVGRPNVGKSTLFNRILEQRDAIVDATSGVTRDRHYGQGEWNGFVFMLIDTGGIIPESDELFDKIDKFKQHFYYGYRLTLSSVLDIIFTNLYQIVIGRYYSASQVGYYSRANTLLMLPVGNISVALNKVVFPLFSKVQDDIVRFKNAYKQIMLVVLFIMSPIIIIMAIMANLALPSARIILFPIMQSAKKGTEIIIGKKNALAGSIIAPLAPKSNNISSLKKRPNTTKRVANKVVIMI